MKGTGKFMKKLSIVEKTYQTSPQHNLQHDHKYCIVCSKS